MWQNRTKHPKLVNVHNIFGGAWSGGAGAGAGGVGGGGDGCTNVFWQRRYIWHLCSLCGAERVAVVLGSQKASV